MKKIACLLFIAVIFLFGCGSMREGQLEVFEDFVVSKVEPIHCNEECGSFQDSRTYIVGLKSPEWGYEFSEYDFMVVGSGRELEKYINKRVNLGVRFFCVKDLFGEEERVKVYGSPYGLVPFDGLMLAKIVRIKEI